MAEFLVRVTDKVNSDFYRNTKCTKRGDVIVVQADGWEWGLKERTLPEYRIVKVVGMPLSEAQQWVEPEGDFTQPGASKTLQRRRHKLNLDALLAIAPAPVVAYVNDDTRAAASLTLTDYVTLNTVRGAKAQKSPIVDPNP
jgi:hypothetical protein